MHGRIAIDTWFWATGGLIGGPLMFWHGLRDLRTKRLMDNTPASRIRSMAMGLVEIDGQIEPRSMLSGPFSGRPCAYWQIDISTRTRNGWTIVHRNSSGHPFFLRDETGVALVYPQGADCRINFGVEEECNGLSLPSCYAEYMEQENLGMRRLWRLDRMRFRERLIEGGQQVFVMGTAMPRARVLDVSEGEAMASTGTEDARATRLQTLDHEVSALVRQGENEKVFIISQQSERTLSTFTGFKAVGEMVGGPLLTLFGLAYWLDEFSKGALFR